MKDDPGKEQKQPEQRSFFTFTLFDLSGAIRSDHLRRASERVKAAWNKLRKSKGAVRGIA